MAMPPKKSGPLTWADFTARLKAIYWPGLAPEAREESRKWGEGETTQIVPDDIWQAAITVFPDPEGWLRNPVPQLNGKSALEACAKGRHDEVRGIIMGVADFFLPEPSEIVPWEELEQAEAELAAEEAAAARAAAPEEGG